MASSTILRRTAHAATSRGQATFWVLCLAAVLRLTTIFALKSYMTTETAYEHHVIATSLVMGLGFSFPFYGPLGLTSQQAPLVPILLAACYSVFGTGHPLALLAFQVIASIASLATVYAVSEIAGRIGGDRPRLLAGLGCAVYPAFVISVTHVQAVSFTTAWLALMVLTGFRAVEDPRPSRLILLAIWAGLGVLTDPVSTIPAALTIGYLAFVWGRVAGWRAVARDISLTAGIVMLIVAPWTMRNWMVHRRLILIKDSFWYVLWQGNGPDASGTDKLILSPQKVEQEPSGMDLVGRYRKLLRDRRQSVSVDSTLPADFRARLAQMPTEIERMDAFGVLIRDFIQENPRHYIRMCLRRLRYFIAFDPTNPKSSHPLYRFSYLGVGALGLVGALLTGRQRRHLALVYGAMLGVALPSIFIITSARFRLPAEAFLLILAALGASGIAYSLHHSDDTKATR